MDQPLIMGILNVTPDSFYEGHLDKSVEETVALAEMLVEEGAAIIDIGGQSSKPGAKRISEQEEADRVLPVIRAISEKHPDYLLSCDTFYASVAQQAVDAGACMINDISAGNIDLSMISTVAQLNVPYVCMHMQGYPENMQDHPQYANVVEEILQFFIERMQHCKEAGIMDIVIDPGFGFGKTVEQNYSLLKHLPDFKILGAPILAGLSRKSMIGRVLDIPASEALNGTTALNTLALLNGANILRVHDVREAREVTRLLGKYVSAQ